MWGKTTQKMLTLVCIDKWYRHTFELGIHCKLSLINNKIPVDHDNYNLLYYIKFGQVTLHLGSLMHKVNIWSPLDLPAGLQTYIL